jgi:ribosomal protein L37AE/L43A
MSTVIRVCASCQSYAIALEDEARGILRCRDCGQTLKARRDWPVLALVGFLALAITGWFAGLG